MNGKRIPEAFLRWGYLQAKLDALGRLQSQLLPDLERTDEASKRGRAIYCGSIGVEFMHIPCPKRRRWVQERMESDAPEPDRSRVLDRLIRADMFERVLQTRYLGTKRYSLEGATALIPLPSESRASTIGLASSTRRPTLATILSMVRRRWASSVNAAFVWYRRPDRST